MDGKAQKEIDPDVLEAARYHVGSVQRAYWLKLPPIIRSEVGQVVSNIVAELAKLKKLPVPEALKNLELIAGITAPAGLALGQLAKGYEDGLAAIAVAIRELLPELAPLAEVLTDKS